MSDNKNLPRCPRGSGGVFFILMFYSDLDPILAASGPSKLLGFLTLLSLVICMASVVFYLFQR